MILLLSLTLAAAPHVAARPAPSPQSAVAAGPPTGSLAASVRPFTVELSRDRALFSVETVLPHGLSPDDAGHGGNGRVVGAATTLSSGSHEPVPVVPVVATIVTIER